MDEKKQFVVSICYGDGTIETKTVMAYSVTEMFCMLGNEFKLPFNDKSVLSVTIN